MLAHQTTESNTAQRRYANHKAPQPKHTCVRAALWPQYQCSPLLPRLLLLQVRLKQALQPALFFFLHKEGLRGALPAAYAAVVAACWGVGGFWKEERHFVRVGKQQAVEVLAGT